ncbi:PD-(D/E)XK nuclease family protein, partial [Albidovulum sp.]
ADELDQPLAAQRRPPCPRPAPRPPVAARPRALWVTGIRTLIRDPYAIYAREILRLRPLPPLHPEADPKLRGIALHRIVEAFVRDIDPDEPEPAAQARLLAIAAQVLADEVAWPAARRLWLGRLERLAGNFVAAERRRALAGWPVVMERGGAVTLEAPRFELRARPDRIDRLTDGRAHVYDYKTGALPTAAQMAAFDKQLLLEAAMVELGGFAELGKREVAAVTHICLGGKGEERSEAMTPEIVAGVWKEFVALIAAYDRRQTGYISRRAVLKADQAEDYDHLARYGEWDMTMKAEPEDVG